MIDNRQVVIHLHTEDVKVPNGELLELGEIAVQHNDSDAALYIKKNNGEIAKFVDETQVASKVSAEKSRAEGIENAISGSLVAEIIRAEGAESALLARIDGLTGSSHTHENKAVLDGITAEKVTAWDGAVSKEHTHDNKALLDTYTQTEENLADAVSKKHLHGNKDVLDGITADKVSAWDGAEQNAKDYADGLAGNYEVAGAAASALTEAKSYADGLADNYEVAGAAASALTEAKSYADGLADNYEVAGAAASALTEAKEYTDTKISDLKLDETYASKAVVDTLVGEDSGKTVRSIAVEEVAKIVANADTDFDTLKEIADWIQNDTTGAASMANDISELKSISADTRLETVEASAHTHENKAVLDGITADKVSAWDGAEQNAKDYADGLAVNYDVSGAAADVKAWVEEQNYLKTHQDISNLATKTEVSDAEGRAKTYADGLAVNYDAVGAAASALTEAKAYADGLADNYEVAGAAASALTEAKAYADGLADNYEVAGAAASALTEAKAYADGLADNYEVAGAAASALTEANKYTDSKVQNLRIDCGTF